ncbi:MAG: ABC transporter permease [Firmicutes bacterium]|nr:ABC transporter permease [Bacillota bacterium]
MMRDFAGLFLSNKKALLGLIILLTFVLVAVFAPLIAPYGSHQNRGEDGRRFPARAPISRDHLLGTTQTSYDIFSQFIYGTRTSLLIGLSTGLLTTFISLTVGLAAGYFGGWVDDVISFIINIFLVLPTLVLIIVIATYITVEGIMPIVLVLAITGWAWGARVIRAQVLSVRQREYVQAAEVLGERPIVIVFREILPNIIPLVMATFLTSTVAAVLGEASLSFLGLGDLTVISWGTQLYWAQNSAALLYGAWWWFLPPGLAIGLLGTSLALLNFAIDEISNPKLRRR